ncbi:60S ribosomal protein uL29 [Kockiozyma suomiensis]|uniref:60S ribosomal protein uL29 n=1 Tax=Kockiozyma suomiensis TaxID=1337062 RepID=UPI003343EA92
MPGVKAYTLREKSKADLEKQLDELKLELSTLKAQKARGGSASGLIRINTVRKSIARVLTVINQQQRGQLRLFYAEKKYLPVDLRVKKTRALRRALTPKQKSLVTEKQKKKNVAFPQRKFALKA